MNWNVLIASVAVIFSVVSYILTRRKELAWKRTEFCFSLSKYLDDDPVLVEAITVLEGRHSKITVADIFDAESSLDEQTRAAYLQKFDKLLNFLWRLCYFYLSLRTLSRSEVEGFGWYFARISDTPSLIDYCENSGFEEINIVIKRLRFDRED